jgi:anhydro-N-acetylmuramic acid kinase
MHAHIKKLYSIADKPERRIIGLMSGTSVDGLDIALCSIKGNGADTKIKVEQFETILYNEDFKNEVKSVFSKKQVDFEKLCLLNPWIALQQAAMINDCLKKWNIKSDEVDLIASHGQTVYHAPKSQHQHEKFGNATLQIGDGDHLAVATGIITISDFRQKHIAAGGEGAPLAVYGDYLVFSKKDENRVMLNMGGIANFTFLSGDLDASKVFSTDTGPGNTMMDAFIQAKYPGKYFDEDGIIAKSGKINEEFLKALKDHPFFDQPFPKTTGPELFNLSYLRKARNRAIEEIMSYEDVVATLNRVTADTIAEAIKKCFKKDDTYVIYASGGGMHNPVLMQHIQRQLHNITIKTTADLEINPDAKEAVLFAILANECICGGAYHFNNEKAGIPSVTMGKISFPD